MYSIVTVSSRKDFTMIVHVLAFATIEPKYFQTTNVVP